MNKNSTWNDIIKPVVVLGTICIVVTGLLGLTNSITQPIIEANAAKAADAARIELLPEATDGFNQLEVDMENVVDMYEAKNGSGHTITVTSQGYGGLLKFIFAFNKDGEISNLKILEMFETPGLGDKVNNPDFLNQFVGAKEEVTDADTISGSTISSNASIGAVNTAIEAYNAVVKGVVVEKEEIVIDPNALTGEAQGFAGKITASVSVDADGKIVYALFTTESAEEGYNGNILKDDGAFVKSFVGTASADDVDVVANATITTTAALEAVKNAMGASAPAVQEPVEEDPNALIGEAQGFKGKVTAKVSMNDDGTIKYVAIVSESDEEGYNGKFTSGDFVASFTGVSSANEVDAVAHATITTQAIKEAVNAALANN